MVQLTLPKGSNVSIGNTYGNGGKIKLFSTFTDGIESGENPRLDKFLLKNLN